VPLTCGSGPAGWAPAGEPRGSVREVLNVFQADSCGCDIVTANDILALKTAGLDLAQMSLDTVRMFATDAEAAGFRL
jgi:transaldolase